MSQQNLVVVRSVYERWSRDPAALAEALTAGRTDYDDFALDLFDPEVEVRQTGAMPDTAGTFHGHEGMIRAAQELHDAFETIEWVPERWTERGEWVIVGVRMVATGKHSGVKTEAPITHSWRVRGGLVTDFRVFQSETQALEAADADVS